MVGLLHRPGPHPERATARQSRTAELFSRATKQAGIHRSFSVSSIPQNLHTPGSGVHLRRTLHAQSPALEMAYLLPW